GGLMALKSRPSGIRRSSLPELSDKPSKWSGVHRGFPVRSRRRPSDEAEDGCVSATAVAVAAETARGGPTAADATGSAVRTQRWMKWAVVAAISVAIAYTVVFSASGFADAVGSLASAQFSWAAVGVACEGA